MSLRIVKIIFHREFFLGGRGGGETALARRGERAFDS